jgi:hypothetical protein
VRWFEDGALAPHGVNLGYSELPAAGMEPAYVPPPAQPQVTPSREALAVGMQAVDTLRPAADAAVSFLRGMSAKLSQPREVASPIPPMPSVASADTEDQAQLIDVVGDIGTASSPVSIVAPALAQPPSYAASSPIFAPAEPRPAPKSTARQTDLSPTGGQRPNGWLLDWIKNAASRR